MQISSTHLVILKNEESWICQSDVCCIIENDIDSNHMYTYFLQTPNISFFLVKSKYFYRSWHRHRYMSRYNDHYISPILKQEEINLICQYEKVGFLEDSASYMMITKPIIELEQKLIELKFIHLSKSILDDYNKILYDDGSIFLHIQDSMYVSNLINKFLNYRKIYLTW